MNYPIYLKNILYLVGICIIAFPFILVNYLQINSLNYNSDIAISFSIFDYIYSINPIFITFILIAPAIILNRVQNTKLLYSIGLNFDRFAIRDVGMGILFSIISLSFIFIIRYIISFGLVGILLDSLMEGKVIILITALNEELFFRGYIFQTIYKKNNSILAIIISSLLFAFAHFIGSDFEIIYFLNIFIAGILLCMMYIKTKSLWCSISFHFAWNTISTSNNFVEHHYLCGIILLILIFIVLKFLKPSYRINRYYLINIE